MKKLIQALKGLLTRVEHAAVGDVEKAMAPFNKVLLALENIRHKATVTATTATHEADELLAKASDLKVIAADAAKKAEAVKAIIG